LKVDAKLDLTRSQNRKVPTNTAWRIVFVVEIIVTPDNAFKFIPIFFGAVVAIIMICGWMYRRAFIMSFGIDALAIDSDSTFFFQMAYAHYGVFVLKSYILEEQYTYIVSLFGFCAVSLMVLIDIYASFEAARWHIDTIIKQYEHLISIFFLCALFAIIIKLPANIITYASVYAQQEAKKAITKSNFPIVRFHITDNTLNKKLNNLNKSTNMGTIREILMDRRNIYVYNDNTNNARVSDSTCKQTNIRCNDNLSIEVMIIPLDKITGLTVIADL
jgi:hypothetical protein